MYRLLALIPALSLIGCASAHHPKASGTDAPSAAPAGIHILSPLLAEPYRLLIQSSPDFAAELTEVVRQGRSIYIGHASDLATRFETPMDVGDHLARVHALPGRDMDSVAVVIFGTAALEATALAHGYERQSLIRELAVILGHEVYGHLIPLWTPPHTHCSDYPLLGKESTGCAIGRENTIRDHLGFPPRPDHQTVDLGFVCLADPSRCLP